MFEDEKGVQLPMGMVSSGTQELVPLFRIFSKLIRDSVAASGSNGPERIREHFLIVEEPEAHIFPNTQYGLMRLFARLSSETWLNFSFAITTHSPYILSSFNNLLEAWQVAAAKPDAKDEVAKLIEERYWIRPSDFKAYCIHDGKLESIMDEETGLINGNYLDGVSNEIGSQFDELLRIGYVEA